MINWLSTKSPRVLDKPMDPAIVQYLLRYRGVDPQMLAADLHICQAQVEAYQRRLGLREFAPTGQRKRY